MADIHWTENIRSLVEQRLEAFFAHKRATASGLSPAASELVDAVADLTLRGGKRLRPAVLYAGGVAVDPDLLPEVSAEAGAALELLQSYLLIHDDWMDGDSVRRGGPTVHVRMAERHPQPQLAASLAVLAGDLASGYAWEMLEQAPFPDRSRRASRQAFARIHEEVVFGQHLDLIAHPDVSVMHQLKTGSYTVRGPLRLGGLLGDASWAQLEALERFGEPIGLAFQLRDDLLGTFGDRTSTGKPTGNDLKAGKHNALVAEARASLPPAALGPLESVLGRRDASEGEVAEATQLLEGSGARSRIEQRLTTLLDEARTMLQNGPFSTDGRRHLDDLIDRLGVRER